MKRRQLLTGAAALAAFATVKARNAAATVTGAVPGAIRWDAWYSQSSVPRSYQNSLGPAAWQSRAPWFTTIDSSYHVTCSPTQTHMDTEIRLAAQAGYKYFAFTWYKAGVKNGPAGIAGMDTGFDLYQASAYKSLVNWCVISGASIFGCSNSFASNDWQFQVNQWVAYFQQSNYQTVLSGRPLVYILWQANEVASWFGGSQANVATAITYLRSQCTAAGVGNPYIVVMNGTGSTAATLISSIGADACSLYTSNFTLSGAPDSFATIDTGTQATWAALATSGSPIIPIVQHGWDTRPRKQNVVSGTGYKPFLGMQSYFTPGTTTQIATQYTEALTYIGANPSICPSKAMLAYSWNECDEGGGAAIPTIGDPPTNAESGQALSTSNLLKAIGPILRAAA